jgi:hypothetical protein
MGRQDTSPFARALRRVEEFSEKHVAVLPEKPGAELLTYLSLMTGEDAQKIARLYDWIIATARLDTVREAAPSALVGFAEEK